MPTVAFAKKLGVVGLINVQYAVMGTTVYVIEANPRASRTVPFISKAVGVPLAKLAADPARQVTVPLAADAPESGRRHLLRTGAALAVLYGPLYAPLLFGQPVPEPEVLLDIEPAPAEPGTFRVVHAGTLYGHQSPLPPWAIVAMMPRPLASSEYQALCGVIITRGFRSSR